MKAKSSSHRAPRKPDGEMSASMEHGMTVNVKKIENGYLSTHSGMTGRGKNQKYTEKHYFHQNNPISQPKPGMRFGTRKK